tara:strand:- start:1067 stop:1993 length:927 start_codon:yes stop_codon:yes gene_type:complete
MNLKKPNFWDYKKPNLIAYFLSPIALIISFLNSRLNKTIKKKFKIRTICVGNIYIGGTGKTSLSIKLNKILNERNFKSCFIKKFYKNQIDEQKLLENNGKLFLSSKRTDATTNAEKENFDVAIFDDGLQDKTIKYDLRFVCFNNINWIGNGMRIPAGPLRESIQNLKNYNHVFLNGNLENIDFLENEILKINPKITIHLGKYTPTNLTEFKKEEKYLVFSGIGNHQTFVSMIKKNGLNILKDIEFPDHHTYTKSDLDNIINEASNLNCKIISTEKDYQRINNGYLSKIKIMKSELIIIDEEKLINSII